MFKFCQNNVLRIFFKNMKIYFKLLILFFLLASPLSAEEVKVFEFTEAEFETLEVRKVRGANAKTQYFLGSNENGNFLKAESNNSASGLGKEIKIDINKTLNDYIATTTSNIISNSETSVHYLSNVFNFLKPIF